MTRYAVVYRDGRALVGRSTLAELSGRSVHTIRARCTVVAHHTDGQALYDMDDALAVLAAIPTRRRGRRVSASS